MTPSVLLNGPLTWRDLSAVARGSELVLSPDAWARIGNAHAVVEAIVAQGIRAYGVNTGVGALVSTVVDRAKQRDLSRNLVMSHACGMGQPLETAAVRGIIAAQINNFAHGRSGVRPDLVQGLLTLLARGCIPEVPSRGSVGYLTHMAHIGLVLIGAGSAYMGDRRLSGREALDTIGMSPLVLDSKEGLSLVNGSPCATGLGGYALSRIERLLAAADAVAALTLEALGAQMSAYEAQVLQVRMSNGLHRTGAALRNYLAGSRRLERAAGTRLQDALSLRAVPHVHGAARDAFDGACAVIDRELQSVTDNPIVSGTPAAPVVESEAHAVAPALAIALDSLAIAIAHLGAISERHTDRLVNPLVSGLPPFLASDPGATTGFMIAQYTASALVADNRRLCAPASLDGGINSALQEDYLAHPTAAATKLLAVIDNTEYILGIELLAATEAHDLAVDPADRAPGTAAIHDHVRACVGRYRDDRPLADHLNIGADIIRNGLPA
ncbi:HAL/PAL/TAL family ammonia-lyase [Nitrospirillum viridazoti]|uniref:Histidine ammonia-lyase n=1 Tax=Nitrospirillum viridazoti CBAmc TaxID=1441467 RepID=A0A248K0L0_9PROT|nr:histidine ammonia-lyase [Nitrospirillum amazonense]ASG24515.1 histidine ammonia-lyase [Nitrospirillum amazonense CBAmc]TWB37138.1 histidine ammonia-lyase [Nitrospirillum amazonense]